MFLDRIVLLCLFAHLCDGYQARGAIIYVNIEVQLPDRLA